jgi:hypothetical protein
MGVAGLATLRHLKARWPSRVTDPDRLSTTANLQYPRILTLFDCGEADGFLF